MAQILYGKAVAEAMAEELKQRTARLKARGVTPALAILRVGEAAASRAYERAALRRCGELGLDTVTVELPEDSDTASVCAAVERINEDEGLHGCLILQPLPKQVDSAAVFERLRPEKDVDGVTSRSASRVFTGVGPGFCPCTAQACLELLDHYDVPLAGRRAAVIGRSLVVGKPLAMLLTARDATVTLCHSRTKDLPGVCREAEILIAAVGRAEMVDERYVNQDQIILDVGVNLRADGHMCGDVAFDKVEGQVKAISPVPGGVGAVTTTVLAKHVIEAAEAARG